MTMAPPETELGVIQKRNGQRIKLTALTAMRDGEIETTVIDAVAGVLSSEKQTEIRDIIQRSIVSAIEHFENQTLLAVFGPEQSTQIRRNMKELNIPTDLQSHAPGGLQEPVCASDRADAVA